MIYPWHPFTLLCLSDKPAVGSVQPQNPVLSTQTTRPGAINNPPNFARHAAAVLRQRGVQYGGDGVSSSLNNAPFCTTALQFFANEGCNMVEMTCEEHDRHAASTQFITHTVSAGRSSSTSQGGWTGVRGCGWVERGEWVLARCQRAVDHAHGWVVGGFGAGSAGGQLGPHAGRGGPAAHRHISLTQTTLPTTHFQTTTHISQPTCRCATCWVQQTVQSAALIATQLYLVHHAHPPHLPRRWGACWARWTCSPL